MKRQRVNALVVGFFLTMGIMLLAVLLPVMSPLAVQAQSDDSALWFQDAILYEVFVRSFRDSDDDGTGDLRGVIDGLDYLESLGVNALWLMPIFETTTYHGYDTVDYYTINPDYGTNEDFLSLLAAAHERGMRIIIDYVANHTSNMHPFFQDAYGNPDSEYAGFYRWQNDAHTRYDSFGGYDYLPALNYESPEVGTYMIDVARYWMDPNGDGDPRDGVDGFRADVASGPPQAFWQAWRSTLKALNPGVLLLGEVWLRNPDELAPYFEDQFDALFDFPLYHVIGGHQDRNGDSLGSGGMSASDARLQLRVAPTYYPLQAQLVRFANNHDTNRIASDVEGDAARMRAVAVWLLTAPGTPMIYYGDEIGMRGAKGRGPLYDELRREPMDWYADAAGDGMTHWLSGGQYTLPDDGISIEEQDSDPASLLALYRTLGQLRREHGALRGNYEAPQMPRTARTLYVLWRWDEEEVIQVIINFSSGTRTFNPLSLGTPLDPEGNPVVFDIDTLTVLASELMEAGDEEGELVLPSTSYWIGRWSR